MGPNPIYPKELVRQIEDLRTALDEAGLESAEVNFDPSLGRPMPRVKSVTVSRDPKLREAIRTVAAADPTNVQEVAASQLALSNSYYASVLDQARQSFRSAIVAGAIGFAFFLAAVAFVLTRDAGDAALISAISGGIAQAIAALNFWLYGRTAQQLDAFHARLEKTQRFLLANSVCEGLELEQRNAARAQLVSAIASETVGAVVAPQ